MAASEAFSAQYAAATNAAGFVRLENWSTLSVAGADRATFLHNMCTNDIRNLPVGGQCEAFFTDVKGKILAHMVVMAGDDELLLVGGPGQSAPLIAHLSRYVIREDVELTEMSSVVSWSLVLGRDAARAIESLPDGPRFRVTPTGMLQAPCRQIWPGGYWVGAAEDADLDIRNAVPCEASVWHALRIESGWPLFGVDFDGSNLPQEVGRDAQAISFRKGCYLGQETIARIDALGHVNKRLATVRLDAEAPVGAELAADGRVVGVLSSVAWSPKLDCWLGLAMVKRGHNEPGSGLVCRDRPAEIIPTPAVVAN